MTSTPSGTTPEPSSTPGPATPQTGPPATSSEPSGQSGPFGESGRSGSPSASKRDRKAHDPLRASRTSGFYTAVIGLGVVLVLLIIFIVQNTEPSSITFLVWEGTAPQAVLLLIATAGGIFLTAAASSLRLLQVRRRVKRERHS